MVKQEETLAANLDIFNGPVNVSEINGIRELISSTHSKFFNNLGTGSEVVPIIDNSIQLDGRFFCFCRKNKFEVKGLLIDSLTLLSSDDEKDPFISQGCYLIKTEDFSFVKSSLFYKTLDESNQVSSFVLINHKDYEKYLKFKKLFSDYEKEINGIEIKAIGGDNMYLDTYYNWDRLFFGENASVRKEIVAHIDQFKKSQDLYKEANVPWKTAIFVTGLPGNGKTELINTIICEYGLDPFTVTCEIDDSVLAATFSYAASKENAVLFIEDVDDLISDNVINESTIPMLLDSFDYQNCNNGLVIIMSAVKLPESYKDILFKFDKVVNLSFPEYDKCIPQLFGRFFSKEKLNQIKQQCKKNNLSYEYIHRLYKLFAKTMLHVNIDKKNDAKYFEELEKILKHITKENEEVNKKYMKVSKKIGLGPKNKEID